MPHAGIRLVSCPWVVSAVLLLAGCGEGEPCQDPIPVLSEVVVSDEVDLGSWEIAKAPDGGFVLAGYAARIPLSSPGRPFTWQQSLDAYVVKMDAMGAVQWATRLGGDEGEEARAVCPAGDGGFVVVGNIGEVLSGPFGLFDPARPFVAKVDSMGNEVWFRTIEADPYTVGYAIAVADDGTFAIAGMTKEGRITGSQDAFVVKFDADGYELWRRNSFGPSEFARDIIATSDGGFAITGYDASGHRDDISHKGLFAVKLNGAGETEWAFRLPDSPNLAYGDAIVETRDGGFAIAGDTYEDLFICKLDSKGQLVEFTRAETVSHTQGFDIIEAADGSLITAGISFAYNAVGIPKCVRAHAMRFSANGEQLWSGRLGSADVYTTEGVTLVESGGDFVLAGTTRRMEDMTSGIYMVTTDAGMQGGE